ATQSNALFLHGGFGFPASLTAPMTHAAKHMLPMHAPPTRLLAHSVSKVHAFVQRPFGKLVAHVSPVLTSAVVVRAVQRSLHCGGVPASYVGITVPFMVLLRATSTRMFRQAGYSGELDYRKRTSNSERIRHRVRDWSFVSKSVSEFVTRIIVQR